MPSSTSIIIFGASGDLSQRKLIPALFSLYRKGQLPADFRIVGFATRPWNDTDFAAAARAGVDQFADFKFTDAEWATFVSRLVYLSGNFTDPAAFAQLAAALTTQEAGPADRLYYLATPPRFYADIVANLGRAGLVSEDEGWRRVIIEKSFGNDEASARALNQRLLDPILAAWQAGKAPLATYEPGSWGPAEADELLARDGRAWLHGCAHEEG